MTPRVPLAALAAVAVTACSHTQRSADTSRRAMGSGTLFCNRECTIEVTNNLRGSVEVLYYYQGSSMHVLGTVGGGNRTSFPINEETMPTNVQVRVGTAQGRLAQCTRIVVESEKMLRLQCSGLAP